MDSDYGMAQGESIQSATLAKQRAYAAQAQNQALGYAAEAPAEPGFTDLLGQGLQALQNSLSETYDHVTAVSDRLLGPLPHPATTANGQINGAPPPMSAGVAIRHQLSAILQAADELARRARVLNQRI